MRISDWSSDVCSSDLPPYDHQAEHGSDADGRKSEKGEHTIGSGSLVDDACDKGEQRLRSINGGAHQSYGLAGVLPPIFNCSGEQLGRAASAPHSSSNRRKRERSEAVRNTIGRETRG